ncbi:DNA-(apurinic or apyrimidinic site) endonuclease [Diachasmimorpha longicaudata]|uniref:DNA-(apurinic or apyrimidinic site) endonuclease n=1 Tax=Diachasmimorpha longicaudata TaxID=58733 RepID=UPI0030B86BF7
MGNSLGSSRLISLIKRKSALERLTLRVPKQLPVSVHRQLSPVVRVTALIPYNMPPSKVRVAKAAASSKSKPEVENPSNDEGDSDVAEPVMESKKSGPKSKKKAPAKENGSEERPKSTRGRKKVEPQEEEEELPEPPKASGRGKKKVEIQEEEEDVLQIPKPTGRGKKKAEAQEEEEEELAEPAKSSGRGKKKAVPSEEPAEDAEPKKTRGKKKEASVEDMETEEAPKKSSRGKKKTEADNEDQGETKPKPKGKRKAGSAEPAPPETDNKSPKRRRKASEEPEVVSEVAVKRVRKTKADVAEEAVVPEEETEEKTTGKRARNAATKAPKGDEDEEKPVKRGRVARIKEKTTRAKKGESGDDDEEPAAKKSKPEEKKRTNKVDTNLNEVDFECKKTNAKGEISNLKIAAWNVGGIRSITDKKGLNYCLKEDPDIIVLQETKCREGDLPGAWNIPGYKRYCADSHKAGYAGVALFTKKEPLDVKMTMDGSPCNDEGRIITAEFENFYVVAVYVPNAGRGLVTLDKKLQWNESFKNYMTKLDEKKPVIVCGDMNVAHAEIDLANPKTNTKHAGFTKEEREGMTDFLGAGFVDTFRHLYPDQTGAYTFWSYMSDSRSRNVGWRLDYFIVSERIKDNICDNVIRNKVFGSDHCPIVLFANL